MKKKTDLMSRIGQLFIAGFPGESPPAAFLDFAAEEQIGGILLFEENCPTHNHTRELLDGLKSVFKAAKPFLAIDQEGGRVSRLRGMPAEFRAPAEYGREGEMGLEHFREDYTRSVVYLESLGFNLNLFPVADIMLNPANACLQDRSFGDSPEQVAAFVRVAAEVTRGGGMFSCLKHFPGLGEATTDPHKAPAVAEYDTIVWDQREAVPFRAGVEAGADFIMTTHMFVPAIDRQLVTGSRQIIADLVRRQLEFDGPIITDDLTMKGAEILGSPGDRAVKAFNAGHDILLFGRDFESAMRAYDYFVDACRREVVIPERLKGALERIAGMKYRLGRSVVY
jgi:beta-N-acetylhexosaminidase